MSWAGLINSRVVIHWFDVGDTINQEVYLNMLKNDIWPKIKNSVASRKNLFQQDKATPHTILRYEFVSGWPLSLERT